MTRQTYLPNLSVLRAFEATVRHGSVSQAAKELHLTDGAVSRAVRDLENTLGFPLFRRGNRMVIPTPTARALAGDIAENLNGLRNAIARASRQPGARPLVLSCEPTFLIRWLIPRLGELQRVLGQERELRLVSAGGAVSFFREGIDLAIRRNDFPLGKDALAQPFLKEYVGPVCRPDIAAGILSRATSLPGILLHTETRPDAWEHWSGLSGVSLQSRRDIRFEHFYLSLQAAVAGAGIAIGPMALVADDIASGTLSAPFGFVADGTEYVLMTSKDNEDKEIFGWVLDWLRLAGTETEKTALAGSGLSRRHNESDIPSSSTSGPYRA